MAKKEIEELARKLLSDFLADNGYELYNLEFLKEGPDWFLRVYIEKKQEDTTAPGETHIGTEDCEKVSRFLSRKLDEKDPIKQNYYLEVSSPGMDRELITDEHYSRYIGHRVLIKLYVPEDGKKEIEGILKKVTKDRIIITDGDEKEIELPRTKVVKTKLAIEI
ncbi:MAG TPA: ribosome maturation factor RimP [Bacillota bacterium]|nr:ribosome maturation factor RimP [Bacillota bacterium]